MRKLAFFLLFALVDSLQAQSNPSLASCRVMTDARERLACYDTLADRLHAPRTSPPSPNTPTRVTRSETIIPGKAPADAFGLPQRSNAPQEVRSAVGPSFRGWDPNSRVPLDNGQVWQVIDGTSVVLPAGARQVAVKRGAFGSFYLDIEGLNTSPKVRRVE